MKESIFGILSSVTNKKESSGTLIEVLCIFYNPESAVFELNENTSFRFCTREIANILGMEDTGTSFAEYEKQFADPTLSFPEWITGSKSNSSKGKGKSMTESKMKELLKGMAVEDDESKEKFRQLMTYFLIEGVLLCGSNYKGPRSSTWWMVKDLAACQLVNWAKETEEHLRRSLAYAKNWLANARMEEGALTQHAFMGCAPALETIIYERIPKLCPSTHPIESPLIQKYISQRKSAKWFAENLSQLVETDIVECQHCWLAVEEASPLAVDEASPLMGSFSELSLSNVAGTSNVAAVVDEEVALDEEAAVDKEAAVDDEEAVDEVDKEAVVDDEADKKAVDEEVAVDKEAAVDDKAVKTTRSGRISRPRQVLSPSPSWRPKKKKVLKKN